MRYNLFTTNGYIGMQDLPWWTIPIYIHSSLIYAGMLYLSLELMVHDLETLTNQVSAKVRKTIGLEKVERIIAEIESLDDTDVSEVLRQVQALTESRSVSLRGSQIRVLRNSRHSMRSSFGKEPRQSIKDIERGSLVIRSNVSSSERTMPPIQENISKESHDI